MQRHRRTEYMVNLGFNWSWSQERIGGRSVEEIDGGKTRPAFVDIKNFQICREFSYKLF